MTAAAPAPGPAPAQGNATASAPPNGASAPPGGGLSANGASPSRNGARPAPATRPAAVPDAAGLLVCAPLRLEARAIRRTLGPGAQVVQTGYGPRRAGRQASRLAGVPFRMLAVTGTGGGVAANLSPGDLVVATEVSDGSSTVACPSAPLLAGELRRAGLPARAGRVVTTGRLVHGQQRDELAAGGALAADLESAPLAAAAGGRPVAVIRAVSDTPQRPLIHPGAFAGGLAALRSLRAAGPVLSRWAAACGQRTVLLAGPRSFCAGVERAIEIVERVLAQYGAPVYVRKQIVHNTHVVADLERRGAVFVDELSEVPDGARVVFSAHGVSPAVRAEAERRHLDAVDATCPLVAKVHAEARRFAAEGYQVALIGHAGHEEVEGTLGEAPDAITLIETAGDVAGMRPRDPEKVAYLMQTTLAVDEASELAGALRERFPATRAPRSDDICYATTNRQQAVRAIAAEAELVLVAGSANSSNSVRLVETAQRAGAAAHLIDSPADIELGWLAGVSTVGITAGASAPPALVGEIVAALSGLGPVEVSERVITTENIRFSLPKEVRSS
jgi:4-hydroxy-3-methylbut-2-en-1-yl diphosphate reductase